VADQLQRGVSRGPARLLAGVDDLGDGLLDGLDAGECAGGGLVSQFHAERVDDASGAGDVVGHPDDAALVQQFGDAWLGELIVGRACDGRASQARHDVAGEDACDGCGDQDVSFGGEDLVGVCPGCSDQIVCATTRRWLAGRRALDHPLSGESESPLRRSVELRRFEPLIPSMRITGARVVQDRSGKSVGRIDLAGYGRGRSGCCALVLHAATLPLKYA
jgi:hypothetical protein